MPSKRRKFTAELEDETVKLVLERGLPITQATKDLDESESTLGRWVQKARAEDQGPALRFPDVPEGAGPGRVGRRAIRKLLPPAQAKTTPCHRLDGDARVGLTAASPQPPTPRLRHALCHAGPKPVSPPLHPKTKNPHEHTHLHPHLKHLSQGGRLRGELCRRWVGAMGWGLSVGGGGLGWA